MHIPTMRTSDKNLYLDAIKKVANGASEVTRSQCVDAANMIGLKYPPSWFVMNKNRHVGRGRFLVSLGNIKIQSNTDFYDQNESKTQENTMNNTELAYTCAASAPTTESFVPKVNSDFVVTGHYNDLYTIIESGMFAPCLLSGPKGTGKTEVIEQICAKLGREMYRCNFTELTDEDALVGSWKLVGSNGGTSMVWQDGPVIAALKRGAILLLDEVDCGTAKTLCLQSPLEGKGKFVDRLVQKIPHSLRFNIVATANTKGRGNDDGRYVGTRVMNEAMLDRFDFWFDFEYPTRAVEKKILLKKMKNFGKVDEQFAEELTKWASSTRAEGMEGEIEVIGTRNLISACKAYALFGNKQKAITLVVTRFDAEKRDALLSLWNKLVDEPAPIAASETPATPTIEFPF